MVLIPWRVSHLQEIFWLSLYNSELNKPSKHWRCTKWSLSRLWCSEGKSQVSGPYYQTCPCSSLDVTSITKASIYQITKGTHMAYTGQGKFQRFCELVQGQLFHEDRNETGFTSSGANWNECEHAKYPSHWPKVTNWRTEGCDWVGGGEHCEGKGVWTWGSHADSGFPGG